MGDKIITPNDLTFIRVVFKNGSEEFFLSRKNRVIDYLDSFSKALPTDLVRLPEGLVARDEVLAVQITNKEHRDK